ncbi:MAG: RluA family pseudouridine synthase [Firmicutes bacterium]|nr:RluA family pseudouridine synthase [Bacillota bacterium]
MIHREIRPEEAGRKLFRYLEILLPGAPKSFLYKAIRMKKIRINGKHPKDEKMILDAGDQLFLFLTDDQLKDFGYTEMPASVPDKADMDHFPKVPVVYEDDRLLIVNKPVGIATQKGKNDPVSLTEIMRQYLAEQNPQSSSSSYHPSFCHRLDKNTSGLLIMAKTLTSHQALQQMLEKRQVKKYYLAVVQGIPEEWRQEKRLIHRYQKDQAKNQALLSPWKGEGTRCELKVRLIDSFDSQSLVKVDLVSGKSHQIRAQLAYEGFPIVGDGKYDERSHVFRQQLVAYELFFERPDEILSDLKGKHFYAAIPETWKKQFTLKD